MPIKCGINREQIRNNIDKRLKSLGQACPCYTTSDKIRPSEVKGGASMDIFVSYLNEACIIISAICFVIGWGQIRKKRVRIHRRWMLTGVVFAALFFIIYALKTFLIGDTKFGGPKSVNGFYYTFLQIHSILATVAAILGVITLVFAAKARFSKHRKIAPWTVITWLVTAATGLVVFLFLYVIFTPGPTANLMQSYLGK